MALSYWKVMQYTKRCKAGEPFHNGREKMTSSVFTCTLYVPVTASREMKRMGVLKTNVIGGEIFGKYIKHFKYVTGV